jgi:hypothetical protein
MNPIASKLREFVAVKYPQWLENATVLENDDIEVSTMAPAGSQADHLVLFTDKGGLWIRFGPPFMCYRVGSVQEMGAIVDAILRDEIRFMVTMKGSEWLETTLVKRGEAPTREAGTTQKLVSWSGKND